MPYLLLGFAALIVFVVLANSFINANPGHLANRIRTFGAVLCFVAAPILAFNGLFWVALPLILAGTYLLSQRNRSAWSPAGQAAGRAPSGGSDGSTSRLSTDHLDVELDLTTGEMRGRVRRGFFEGQRIETLKPVELALLWQDCRFSDPQSAQILEAYLDRIHPTWRDDMARAEAEAGQGPDGKMDAAQALDILGLKPGASDDEVRRAHKE
ncbi:MAG: hypothetical protein AAFR04_15695, partial [Pseudomonadota bacterium]